MGPENRKMGHEVGVGVGREMRQRVGFQAEERIRAKTNSLI